MFSDESGGRSALIILLLLPAPLTAIAIMLGLVLVIADDNTINVDLGGGETEVQLAPQPTHTLSAEVAALATINAAPDRPPVAAIAPADVALALGYDENVVQTGRINFLGTCAGCHGTDAHGITGLGKTLIESEFVRGRSDQELLDFVVVGRQPFDPENTTGVQMPPRGGNPGLTDEDLLTIIAYVRTLDGFAPEGSGVVVAAAETPEAAPQTPSEPVEYVRLDVSGLLESLGVELQAPPPTPDRDGETAFEDMCGTRYEDLVTVTPDYCDVLVEIVDEGELDDDELFTLLQEGSPIWDENNTTGVHFPARGGYPPLNDTEIMNLIEYLGERAAE